MARPKKVTNEEFGLYLTALGTMMQQSKAAFSKINENETRMVAKLEEYGIENSRALFVYDRCWGWMRGVRPVQY